MTHGGECELINQLIKQTF